MTRTVAGLVDVGLVAPAPTTTDGRQVLSTSPTRGRGDPAGRPRAAATRGSPSGSPSSPPTSGRSCAQAAPILDPHAAGHRVEPHLPLPADPQLPPLRRRRPRRPTSAPGWAGSPRTGSCCSSTATSGDALGIVTGLQFLPFLLLAPWAGLIADRFPKRRLLAITQTVLAVPAAVSASSPSPAPPSSGTSTSSPCPRHRARRSTTRPGRPSSPRWCPDDLANAVALNSASFNAAPPHRPRRSPGVLIAAFGGGWRRPAGCPDQHRVTFVAVIVALLRLRTGELQPAPDATRGQGGDPRGLRATCAAAPTSCSSCRRLRAGTFGMNFQITMALMATKVFDKGAEEYGLLGSIMAIGSLTGALLSARRGGSGRGCVLGAALAFAVRRLAAGCADRTCSFALIVPGRALRPDRADHGQRHDAAGDDARHARPGDGALHGDLHGRHARRGAAHRLDRRGVRARWTLVLGGGLTIAWIALASLLFARAKGVTLAGLQAQPVPQETAA